MSVWRHYVLSAAPGKEEAMVDALKHLASKVRPLAGCEGVEWGRDAENPAEFVFVEAWTSADATVAAVSNSAGSRGLLTGVAKGATTITATLGAQNQSVNVTVSDATLSTITVSPPAPAIAKGTTQAFTATGVYSDGSTQDLTATVAWSSGTPAVATISNAAADRGTATGVAKGTSIITATTGGKSGTATLNVTDATLTGLTVTPATPTVPQATRQQFVATGTYSDGSTQNLTASASWSSSDPSVVSVSSAVGSKGLASTLAAGRASA